MGTFMVMGCLGGMMEGCMMGNEQRIKWMEKEFSLGKMGKFILESM